MENDLSADNFAYDIVQDDSVDIGARVTENNR